MNTLSEAYKSACSGVVGKKYNDTNMFYNITKQISIGSISWSFEITKDS